MGQQDKFKEYARRQKAHWNVASLREAEFERIYLGQEKSEAAWRKSAEQDFQKAFSSIVPRPDWTILEIGCGVGRIAEELLNRGVKFHRFIGVDVSEKMIAFAKERVGRDPRVQLSVVSGYDLAGIPDRTADFTYSIDVFIHIFDEEITINYLSEVRRILKDGGIFRFNILRFDPATAFSNRWGGRFAKWMFGLGLWSAGKHRWDPQQPVGFNGNQYMLRDVKRLIHFSKLSCLNIQTERRNFWCTLQKPSGPQRHE